VRARTRIKIITSITSVVVLGVVLAACGSSGSKSGAKSTTSATETPTLPATTTTTSPPSPQQGTATPSTGLHDGQTIQVKVTGFLPVPKNPVGINECAQKGTANVDTPDCALNLIVPIKINPDGTGTASFKVASTKIGSANHTCGGDTRCFLSIGELSADPKVERTDDVNLTFAS
jgi:hypothetical protein